MSQITVCVASDGASVSANAHDLGAVLKSVETAATINRRSAGVKVLKKPLFPMAPEAVKNDTVLILSYCARELRVFAKRAHSTDTLLMGSPGATPLRHPASPCHEGGFPATML